MLTALPHVVKVVPVDEDRVRHPLALNWTDFDDAVQAACVAKAEADYLMTRGKRRTEGRCPANGMGVSGLSGCRQHLAGPRAAYYVAHPPERITSLDIVGLPQCGRNRSCHTPGPASWARLPSWLL